MTVAKGLKANGLVKGPHIMRRLSAVRVNWFAVSLGARGDVDPGGPVIYLSENP
jgi:hypothetical protein